MSASKHGTVLCSLNLKQSVLIIICSQDCFRRCITVYQPLYVCVTDDQTLKRSARRRGNDNGSTRASFKASGPRSTLWLGLLCIRCITKVGSITGLVNLLLCCVQDDLEALQERDPEFYNYLKQTDSGLLDFKEDDSDEEEAGGTSESIQV